MKQATTNLINDVPLFAKYWAEADLSTQKISYHSTLADAEKYGSMDIAFVNLNEFDSIERAIVTIIKKHIYYCQEWGVTYTNDTTEVEWREYLKKHWIPIYFDKPIFNKDIYFNELAELDFNYETIHYKNDITSSYKALYSLLNECEIVHFNDESSFINYFLACDNNKDILYLSDCQKSQHRAGFFGRME
ncbi:MAG: hypothetical protein AAGU32_11330 [Bacillota bacterium]